ncbi:DNA replication and repair protein RecF [Opitutales bacterium]|uniref:DNA replication/repair protein RecF n=1 Tax=Candidatus Seribacter sulfatis TaxID=3381756 RepID=UPI002318CC2F|nr:DNA replication and repair protein RecF [Opitutales bacterium]
MRLLDLNLENFRNIESANLTFSGNHVFFIGANGQGKTNLLEAIGISSNLRSFRKSGMDGLVRVGTKTSRLFFRFKDEKEEDRETLFQFHDKGEKQLEVDGEKIKRFSDYLGEFPAVTFSSRDFRLVREGPSDRRKWLDLLLSSSSAEYFEALKIYHRSLRERNALLKKGGGDRELDAFEQSLIPNAYRIYQFRLQALPIISETLSFYYESLSNGLEKASVLYRPDLELSTLADFSNRLLNERMKDRQFGTTRRGPHRDDFEFLLDGKDARNFASEGQQRGLVLGLRFAEFEYLKKSLSRTPILLIDDVLGELDEKRKANFKDLLPLKTQVFATGTSFPTTDEKSNWESFQVDAGKFVKN